MADRPPRRVKRHPLDPLRLIQKYINEKPRLREVLTRLRYGSRDRDMVLFRREVRINTLRENGYYRASRLARANSLLRDETIVLQRVSMLLGPGVTFVDIGANAGIFSSVIADAQRLFDDFRVVAFEANPDTFARLEVNAERFGFEAINVALAAAEGERVFATGAASGIAAATEHAGRAHIPGRTFTVAARRLDSFDLPGKLVLKIDVEGMELEILHGAKEFFDAGRVDAIYFDEFGDKGAVLDLLAGYGFEAMGPFRLIPYSPGVRAMLAVKRG